LCFGNALDLALNDMLMGSDKFHEVFDHEWGKYEKETIAYFKSDLNESLLTEQEKTLPEAQRFFLSLKAKGHLLLDAYFAEIFPKIKKVISIQGEVTLHGYDEHGNETDDSIYGKLDLIAMIEDNNGVIHEALLDNKTTSEPYAKNSVRTKDQLALYANGFPELKSFGYLTLNKKNFKTQIIIDSISDEKKEEVLLKFVDRLERIKNEEFAMNKKSCYAFGRRCEFYTHCHYGKFSDDIYEDTKEK
jgi:hypothetical protein